MPRTKLPRNVGRAKTLRAEMSLPEVLLWQQLRGQGEAKFRRQHPLGSYVLDFYCAKAKVCVEVMDSPTTQAIGRSAMWRATSG